MKLISIVLSKYGLGLVALLHRSSNHGLKEQDALIVIPREVNSFTNIL